jgi:2-polyprenyl-3-methyl-5-hydroxy-6-metoxy-1,4-benzoquinol methylase
VTLSKSSGGSSPEQVRFEFGRNWARFLSLIDDDRIASAQESMRDILRVTSLQGQTIVDIGSGSGLFSLAAKRLGAARVHSFDYDVNSVACTRELKSRFFPDDSSWTVEHGSVLDEAYVRSLGTFDVVYSWGVLHHTGDLWRALGYTVGLVKPGGRLCIAIYNDQGATSRRWRVIKRLYNRGPPFVRALLLLAVRTYFGSRTALGWVARGGRSEKSTPDSSRQPVSRGMSNAHDLVDWVGGYPFEVAKPEEVFDFCRSRGFVLQRLKTVGGGLANNEFVFEQKPG